MLWNTKLSTSERVGVPQSSPLALQPLSPSWEVLQVRKKKPKIFFTLFRFEPTTNIFEPLSKDLRVVNRCTIPITISWIIVFTQSSDKGEETDDNLNLYTDSNLDSNHSEESNKSVKVYLPKNASGNGPTFFNIPETKGTLLKTTIIMITKKKFLI